MSNSRFTKRKIKKNPHRVEAALQKILNQQNQKVVEKQKEVQKES